MVDFDASIVGAPNGPMFLVVDQVPDDAEPLFESAGGEIVLYAAIPPRGKMLSPDLPVYVESPGSVIITPLGSALSRGQWFDVDPADFGAEADTENPAIP